MITYGDWPHFRGSNYDGISPESINHQQWINGKPKEAWRANVGIGFSGCVVSKGHVYSMGNINKNTDVITCLAESTGKVVWTKKYSSKLKPNLYEGGPNATPTISAGRLFSLSKNGDMFCLNARTGKVLWERHLVKEINAKVPRWGFSGSPLVIDNLVIVNVCQYGMALSVKTGKTVWQTDHEKASGNATPLLFELKNEKCLAIFSAEAINAVDYKTGKLLNTYPWKTNNDVNAADPISLDNDRWFITSGYGKGCGVVDFSTDKGKLVWGNKKILSQFMSPVLWEDHIYCLTSKAGSKGKLVCLDPKTGKVKWQERVPAVGNIMIANDELVMLGAKGTLTVIKLSSQKYESLATAKVISGKCWTAPSLTNGKLYVRNAVGDIICYDVSH